LVIELEKVIIMEKFYVRYLGEDEPGYFLKDKIYEVIGKQEIIDTKTGQPFKTMYSIIDESGEDYMYSLEDNSQFEIVNPQKMEIAAG
jgi:hypothetical protein